MRFSKYNLIETMDYGLIIYNMLNSKYVKLITEESVNHFNKLLKSESLSLDDVMTKALYEQKYIVDDDVNEYELAKERINRRLLSYEKELSILLYVTEQCNFRCVYCPEKHVNKRFSAKRWDSLYKYIETNIKNGKYDYIKISFFGGEPLLEAKSILEFLEKLEALKKDYPDVYMRHSMTTNGYLLTPEIYDKLTKYNVKHYQITVDGFAENHDKTRPRVDGEGTWERIVENLKYINTKDDDVSINLRSNISPLNKDSASEFIKWEVETFDNSKFTFSVEAVNADTGDVPEEYASDPLSEDILEIDTQVNKTERSFSKNKNHPLRILGFTCNYAVTKHAYTITTDGKISKCGESALGIALPIGELTDDGNFEFYENYKDWVDNFEYSECESCEIYPLCGGRSCVYKKVVSQDGERFDCANVRSLKPYIVKYLREGFLD